jgi:hypothetical protein
MLLHLSSWWVWFFQNVLVSSKWTQHIRFFNEFHYILLNHLNLLEYNYIVIPPPKEFCECISSCGKVCKKSSPQVQFIFFIHYFYAPQHPLLFNHHSLLNNLFIIQSSSGTHQRDLLGGPLFILTHFRALCSLTSLFPSCLFPSITNDTHIIGPTSIVFQAFDHFSSQLDLVSLVVQPYKCVV